MAQTQAHIKASAIYNKKAYEEITLRVKTGKKADLQTHAANNKESLNGFVNRAIAEAVERDNEKEGE